ncbi:MAG: hydA [Chloroflexi bacterium]|nr:hydA [Chloroflexota bacterium]
MRTLIVNGTVVTADGSVRADVLVDGEQVALVEPDLPARGVTAEATVDAAGRWVVPGAIDVHTHFELPLGGTAAKDTWATGTTAAAFGGTTTVIDFAAQQRGGSLRAGVDASLAQAEGRAAIDYGLHIMVSDVNDASLAEMDLLVADGVPTFKLFTAYPETTMSDDGAIYRAMRRAAVNGGLVMIHAENGLAIDAIVAENIALGRTEPVWHGRSRPAVLEGEATNRAIRLAEVAGVPVYIVHLSSRDALEEVRTARRRGTPAWAETCPQYLFLSLDDLDRPGFEGAKFVCSPPLRPRDHQEDLWDGLAAGDLQAVATDHCPFDFHGQKELGRGDFRRIPNGLPGIEDRVDLVHHGGVAAGRFGPERWVDIVATTPAKLFGLYPRKGTIAPGSDADLVIYDHARRRTISAATHHMNVDYSCYEGLEVQGAADLVMSRGAVLVRDGTWVGPAGHGRFLRRAPATFARGA